MDRTSRSPRPSGPPAPAPPALPGDARPPAPRHRHPAAHGRDSGGPAARSARARRAAHVARVARVARVRPARVGHRDARSALPPTIPSPAPPALRPVPAVRHFAVRDPGASRRHHRRASQRRQRRRHRDTDCLLPPGRRQGGWTGGFRGHGEEDAGVRSCSDVGQGELRRSHAWRARVMAKWCEELGAASWEADAVRTGRADMPRGSVTGTVSAPRLGAVPRSSAGADESRGAGRWSCKGVAFVCPIRRDRRIM